MPEILQRLLSLILIIVFSPLMLLISIIIKLDSKGSVIHKRVVIGKNCKMFGFLKFRTMVESADEILEKWKKYNHVNYQEYFENIKLRNDPRITSVGRFLRKSSLDEIPQFFNVLKGDMNLIGPRPLSNEEINKYDKDSLFTRSCIKPGITGYWQVCGRQDLSYDERIKADNYYIENRSFKLDMVILFKTIFVVLSSKGAY